MMGPGKYDDLATQIREKAKASGVLVIVFDGEKGSGFSAQLPLELMVNIPQMLRSVAEQIEQSGPFM